MAILLLAIGVYPTPASAVLYRLPNGHVISYQPSSTSNVLAAPSGASAAPSAIAQPFDTAFGNVDYGGGPVMPSNRNYTIVWTPENYTGPGFEAGYVNGVNQFFIDLAHDSAMRLPTNSDAVATQYNDAAGAVAAYDSSFGGSINTTDPLPANGCPASGNDVCLTVSQLEAELDRVLTANGLPRDFTHEYFLLTPAGIADCTDAGGVLCSENSGVGANYCGFHSLRSTSAPFVYADVPDLTHVFGCDPLATSPPCDTTPCAPPTSAADSVLTLVAHEHDESITDPDPPMGWTNASSDPANGEIGDLCNNDAWQDPKTTDNPQPGGEDAPFNETINGHHYWIQMMWSNQNHKCQDSFVPNGNAAHASFTASEAPGTAFNFDASASTATGGVMRYVWQFNDSVGSADSLTLETTSPTIAHGFVAPGLRRVALTVVAPDGTSNGAERDVVIPAPPAAAFVVSPPSLRQGIPATLDGSASTDPNPGGAIISYVWHITDGSVATGETCTPALSRRPACTAWPSPSSTTIR